MSLIFVLVLVVMFWIMPSGKIEDIGDFFEKIITPVSVPLALYVAWRLGLTKYRQIKNGKNKEL
jgi:hypothetical protein